MRGKFKFILGSIILISFTAFALINFFSNKDNISFNAVILEVTENSILVRPDEGSSELRSADLISAAIREKTKIIDENKNKLDKTDLKANQKVVIYYDGLIAESYPAQIFNCHKIKVQL